MPDAMTDARMTRANQMLEALRSETDRGKACVGDAMLDELFEDLLRARFVDDTRTVKEMLAVGQPLASHGVRLTLAYLLGWIGADTYHACRTIHKVRNTMAHSIEIDSFDADAVKGLIDEAKPPQMLLVSTKDGFKRVNLTSRADKFLIIVVSAMMQLWKLIDDSTHAIAAKDLMLLPAGSLSDDG